jgi:hypothetical protein
MRSIRLLAISIGIGILLGPIVGILGFGISYEPERLSPDFSWVMTKARAS